MRVAVWWDKSTDPQAAGFVAQRAGDTVQEPMFNPADEQDTEAAIAEAVEWSGAEPGDVRVCADEREVREWLREAIR